MNSKLPPAVAQYFEEKQQEQRFYEKTALVQKNLRQTSIIMTEAMDKLSYRGNTIQDVEDASEELLESSELFMAKVSPGPIWKRICCCCCHYIPKWWPCYIS